MRLLPHEWGGSVSKPVVLLLCAHLLEYLAPPMSTSPYHSYTNGWTGFVKHFPFFIFAPGLPHGFLRRLWVHYPSDVAWQLWLQNISGMAVGSCVVQFSLTYGNHCETGGTGREIPPSPPHTSLQLQSYVQLSADRVCTHTTQVLWSSLAFLLNIFLSMGVGSAGCLAWLFHAQLSSVPCCWFSSLFFAFDYVPQFTFLPSWSMLGWLPFVFIFLSFFV